MVPYAAALEALLGQGGETAVVFTVHEKKGEERKKG